MYTCFDKKVVVITGAANGIGKATSTKFAENGAQVVLMARREDKLKELKEFQVNSKLMSLAKKNAIFLHCLPASIGKEVTKEVLYGKQSKVYSQAENRISSVKSVIEYCLK